MTSDASAFFTANKMALPPRLVIADRRLFRRERVSRDRMTPFDRFDEREMLERYRFGKEDLWKINDEMLGGGRRDAGGGDEMLGGGRSRIRQYLTG